MGEIIGAIAEFGTTFIDVVFGGKRARYDRLPDWMNPKDFQKNDRTADIILIGLVLVLIIVIVSIGITARRAQK